MDFQFWMHDKVEESHEEDYIEWMKRKECADERTEIDEIRAKEFQRH